MAACTTCGQEGCKQDHFGQEWVDAQSRMKQPAQQKILSVDGAQELVDEIKHLRQRCDRLEKALRDAYRFKDMQPLGTKQWLEILLSHVMGASERQLREAEAILKAALDKEGA